MNASGPDTNEAPTNPRPDLFEEAGFETKGPQQP